MTQAISQPISQAISQTMSQPISRAAAAHRPDRAPEPEAPDMTPQDAAPAVSRLGFLGLLADVISGGKLSELRERLDRSLANETRLYNDIHRETMTADHATSALRSLQEELASSKALNRELLRMAGPSRTDAPNGRDDANLPSIRGSRQDEEVR